MIGATVGGITSDYGSSYSELYYPTAVYVNPSNTMYILDWTNCRVLKWQLGEPLGSVIAGGHGCGSSLTQIDNSYGLFVDNQSNIYISEYRNHRVVLWTPNNITAGILVFSSMFTESDIIFLLLCRWRVVTEQVAHLINYIIHGDCMSMRTRVCTSWIIQITEFNTGHMVSKINLINN